MQKYPSRKHKGHRFLRQEDCQCSWYLEYRFRCSGTSPIWSSLLITRVEEEALPLAYQSWFQPWFGLTSDRSTNIALPRS